MSEERLYLTLIAISGVSDFELELKPSHSKRYWGRYYPNISLIRLYALDEVGNQLPDEDLIREGLHELTHHIQYHHIPFWERKKGIMHDSDFWMMFKGMYESHFGKELDAV